MGIRVQLKQDLNFAKTKFTKEAAPIILKNNMPNVYNVLELKNLSDVAMDNPVNNSVLIYNSADQLFHLNQLNLDGGTF